MVSTTVHDTTRYVARSHRARVVPCEKRIEQNNRTARGLQYSGPVITLRVQYGLQIQYNTIQSNKIHVVFKAPKELKAKPEKKKNQMSEIQLQGGRRRDKKRRLKDKKTKEDSPPSSSTGSRLGGYQ